MFVTGWLCSLFSGPHINISTFVRGSDAPGAREHGLVPDRGRGEGLRELVADLAPGAAGIDDRRPEGPGRHVPALVLPLAP